MSDAAATDAPPPKKLNKKLIIIIAAVVVLVAGGGGATFMLLQKKAAAAEAEAEEDTGDRAKPAKAAQPRDSKAVPTFVPLDPFTVNLADRDTERYAQVGIILEIEDAKVADRIKAFMPAIRNNILLALADRTAAELMDRDGKRQLADRIKREASIAMGAAVAEPKSAKKSGKKESADAKASPELPITAVHFSNFIIQ